MTTLPQLHCRLSCYLSESKLTRDAFEATIQAYSVILAASLNASFVDEVLGLMRSRENIQ
jgi:hypothetical protein